MWGNFNYILIGIISLLRFGLDCLLDFWEIILKALVNGFDGIESGFGFLLNLRSEEGSLILDQSECLGFTLLTSLNGGIKIKCVLIIHFRGNVEP